MAAFAPEDFLVILHLSTTLDEHQVCVSLDASELIELAWIVIDARTLQEKCRQSLLVRPTETPVTELCTNTTALTWSDLESASTFQNAIKTLDQSLRDNIDLETSQFSFIVLDKASLRIQLPREARDKGCRLPEHLAYARIYDLRGEYTRWQTTHAEAAGPDSLMSIFASIEMQVRPVDRHRGGPGQTSFTQPGPFRASEICNSLYRTLHSLLQQSSPEDELFTKPLDGAADLRAFHEEDSKVLYLSGLAADTTQSELESWFTQHGGRPIAFWTLRTPDLHKPTGLGFAVFSSHEEATESLDMNGRMLGDRLIEVSCSSNRILDRASDILTPFPPSKNRPRPGDWTCPSCGFSNFQRRTACFRCSYPAGGTGGMDPMGYYPLHSSMPPMQPLSGGYPPGPGHTGPMRPMTGSGGGAGGGGGHVPFRAGDWTCQACIYHNFARNSVCLKCSMPRAPPQDMLYNDYGGNYSMGHLSHDFGRQQML